MEQKIICEICSCDNLIRQDDGLYRCSKCGVYYTPSQLRKMMSYTNPEKSSCDNCNYDESNTETTLPTNMGAIQRDVKAKSFKIDNQKLFSTLSKFFTVKTLIIFILVFCVLHIVISCTQEDVRFAKKMAKEEVIDFWHDFDPSSEVTEVKFTNVKKETVDDDFKREYIAEHSNTGLTIDGRNYSSYSLYWKNIGYDPYSDDWIVYELTGKYKVKLEGDVCNGEFTIRILCYHDTNQTWGILKTEMELPKQLQQKLKDYL